MKKLTFWKSLFLLFALIVGTSTSWAQVDYATLPFNWEGGSKTDLEAVTGVVAVNADSKDYSAKDHSPYLIKFNGNGKYITIKTNEQPGKVTIGVKMIGGNVTSTITVQESDNGETFSNVQVLSISGNTNDVVDLETTNSFKSTTRYVKLYYTKGSNIGVGPITIAKASSGPTANLSTTSLVFGNVNIGTTKELTFTVTPANLTGDLTIASNNAKYTVSPTSIAQATTTETTITVTAAPTAKNDDMDGTITISGGGLAASKTVTLTATPFDPADATVYEKVTSTNQLVAGNEYILVAPTSGKAMGAQDGNIRGHVDVTVTDDKVTIINEAVAVLTLGGSDDEWTFLASDNDKYLALTAGSNQIHASDDATLETSQWIITDDFELNNASFSSRYLRYNSGSPRFACYESAQQTSVLFVKAGSNVKTTLNSKGYATYSSAYEFEVSSGAKAYTAKLNTANKEITCYEITGKIPAGAGVLLYGDAGATVVLSHTTDASALTNNDLKGTTTASGETVTKGSNYYYVLSGDTFMSYSGSAFAANKAYFESDTELSSKAFAIVFEGETTAINGIEEVAPVVTKTRKVVKNGRLVIETANGEFTIDGARVK